MRTAQNSKPLMLKDEDPNTSHHQLARTIVLRQLTAAPKTRKQLAEKLQTRQIPDEVITQVLDRFEEVQLIDDQAFAQSWVRSRHRSKGLARTALKHELQNKGITGHEATEALAELSDEDEWQRGLELVRRKTTRLSVPMTRTSEERTQRDKIVRRLVGMLARKGYRPAMAFSIVNTVLDEHQDDADL